jgi:signal transduction histidine kinase
MVGLIDDERRHINAVASVGEPRAFFEQFKRPVLDDAYLAGTATGRALAEGRAIAVEDYTAWSGGHALSAETVRLGVRSFVVAPLLVAAMQVRVTVPIRLTAETECRLSAEAETAIFRIVQEALGNATKYAEATEIDVTLKQVDDRLVASVTDNGIGFDLSAPVTPSADGRRGGMGMRSMRERAAAAGLTLRLESSPGSGTCITVEAPVR